MLKLELTFDETDYNSVINVFFPIIIKNKLLCKVATHTATARLKNKNNDERDACISSLINENKQAIVKKINLEAEKMGTLISLADLNADIT